MIKTFFFTRILKTSAHSTQLSTLALGLEIDLGYLRGLSISALGLDRDPGFSQHTRHNSVSQLWDWIDLGFCEDISTLSTTQYLISGTRKRPGVFAGSSRPSRTSRTLAHLPHLAQLSISAVGLDKDLVFLRGYLGHCIGTLNILSTTQFINSGTR